MKIVDLMLEEVRNTLKEQNISLDVTEKAKEKLVEIGYHPSFGARPLRRVIQEHIEDKIADILLDGEVHNHLIADVENEEIVIRS